MGEDILLQQMPRTLRKEVMIDINMRTLRRTPLFLGADKAMVSLVCSMLVRVSFLKGELLAKQGDVVSELLILESGMVLQVIMPPDKEDKDDEDEDDDNRSKKSGVDDRGSDAGSSKLSSAKDEVASVHSDAKSDNDNCSVHSSEDGRSQGSLGSSKKSGGSRKKRRSTRNTINRVPDNNTRCFDALCGGHAQDGTWHSYLHLVCLLLRARSENVSSQLQRPGLRCPGTTHTRGFAHLTRSTGRGRQG